MKERDKSWEQKLKEHHDLEEKFRQQEERYQLQAEQYRRQEEELKRIKDIDRDIDSSITKSAVNLQQYYDKKVQELHTDYERKLRDRDEADVKRSLDEINRLKSSNVELKENLAQNKCELERQMRQFVIDRASLAKQIQALHSKIATLERENKQLTSRSDSNLATLTETIKLKTLEYENISKRRQEEEEKYNKLQELYKSLSTKIELDSKALDELNKKHNIALASNKQELAEVQNEYQTIHEKLIVDREEYTTLLVKKEELHTELVNFKEALDLYSSKHKITSHDDLVKLRDGFDNILLTLKGLQLK